MKKRVIAAVLSAVLAGAATAGARLVETQVHLGGDNYETYYSIEIAADGTDVGLPGGFFIGVVRDNSEILSLGATSGWTRHSGGMAEAVEWLERLPGGGAARYYHPLTGAVINKPQSGWSVGYQHPNSSLGATRTEICMKAGNSDIDIYAGIGALTPDKEELVRTFHAEHNPRLTANHLRNVYLQQDMSQNKKIWQIGTFQCRDSGGA